MADSLRNFVRQRAGNRCEYCRIRYDDFDVAEFHVEHIIARQPGGTVQKNSDSSVQQITLG
jgi:hypothetical protein